MRRTIRVARARAGFEHGVAAVTSRNEADLTPIEPAEPVCALLGVGSEPAFLVAQPQADGREAVRRTGLPGAFDPEPV